MNAPHVPATPAGASATTISAFFDVDNTIIRGASSFHIARGLKQRGFFTNRDVLRFAWEQFKYNIFGETKEQMAALRAEALSIIKGWSVAEMVAIGEEVYDEVLALRIFPGTKAIIDEHRAQGHEVWLVTASPVEVGRMIARHVGATGALGTVAEHRGGYYTGVLEGPMLHGPHKAEAVRALAADRGLRLEKCFAYGDSMNDAPMLSEVGRPCAINPDRRLRAHAKRQGWPIKDFRAGDANGRRGIVKASLTGSVWAIMQVMRGVKRAACAPFKRRKTDTEG